MDVLSRTVFDLLRFQRKKVRLLHRRTALDGKHKRVIERLRVRMPTMRQWSGQQLFGIVEELCNAGIGICTCSDGQGQMKLSVIRNANLSADQPLRIESYISGFHRMILWRIQ